MLTYEKITSLHRGNEAEICWKKRFQPPFIWVRKFLSLEVKLVIINGSMKPNCKLHLKKRWRKINGNRQMLFVGSSCCSVSCPQSVGVQFQKDIPEITTSIWNHFPPKKTCLRLKEKVAKVTKPKRKFLKIWKTFRSIISNDHGSSLEIPSSNDQLMPLNGPVFQRRRQ